MARSGVGDAVPRKSNTESKTGRVLSEANYRLADRIRDAVGTRSLRSIAKSTGYQRETIRRYLQGTTTIPAVFVVALCESYGFDPAVLLSDRLVFKHDPQDADADQEPPKSPDA